VSSGQAKSIIEEVFPEEGAGDAIDASLDRHVVSLCQVRRCSLRRALGTP